MSSSTEIIQFRALQLANDQRSAYGLRYHDYARYRKHCANRTHRLRSTLKMTHGKGRDFKKLPPLKLETIKAGHLELYLIEAERAWAYSQELQADSLKPANQEKASTLRHHCTGRFRRAVNWSTQLLSHCQSLYSASRLSAHSLLEITVYTLILNGRFLKYREDLEDALIQLSVARSILDVLAAPENASSSRDQALATLWADEIGTEIRFCAHELGRAKAYDVDGIVSEFAQKHSREFVDGYDALIKAFLTEVRETKGGKNGKETLDFDKLVWEGEPVPVRNPELVDVLLKVQEAERKLVARVGQDTTAGTSSKKGIAAYDSILNALSEAEEISRKLVEAQQLGDSQTASILGPNAASTGSRDIHFLNAYIVYQLLSRRIQRDSLLLSALLSSQKPSPSGRKTTAKSAEATSSSKLDPRLPPALIKLLDTILQSLTQMRNLSIVDDSPSPELSGGIDARIAWTKARRCLYLSQTYTPLKRYAEALVLLQHASLHIREVHSALSISGPGVSKLDELAFYPLESSALESLSHEIDDLSGEAKRDWFLYNGGAVDLPSKKGETKPKGEYKKPLFFNVAFNHIAPDVDRLREKAGLPPLQDAGDAPTPATASAKPTLEDKERAETPEPSVTATPSRGGLSSLLGGWWGRS